MRLLPPVTEALVIIVTALSLFRATYNLWGTVKIVAKVAEGELDKGPRPETEPIFLELVLGKTPWWAAWTLLTTGFIETKLIPYVLFLVVACSGGKFCERVLSSRGYAGFLGVLSFVVTFIEVITFGRWMTPPIVINGTYSLQAGIMVALRQLIPGHTIILFRKKLRIQIKWLPLTFLGLVTLLSFGKDMVAAYLGVLEGWYLLRYHVKIEGIGVGDASDALSFANLFPNPLAAWLEPILNKIHYLLCTKLHFVRAFTPEEIEEANQRYAARLSGTLLPAHANSARATNERRKMMLRAMDRDL